MCSCHWRTQRAQISLRSSTTLLLHLASLCHWNSTASQYASISGTTAVTIHGERGNIRLTWKGKRFEGDQGVLGWWCNFFWGQCFSCCIWQVWMMMDVVGDVFRCGHYEDIWAFVQCNVILFAGFKTNSQYHTFFLFWKTKFDLTGLLYCFSTVCYFTLWILCKQDKLTLRVMF